MYGSIPETAQIYRPMFNFDTDVNLPYIRNVAPNDHAIWGPHYIYILYIGEFMVSEETTLSPQLCLLY